MKHTIIKHFRKLCLLLIFNAGFAAEAQRLEIHHIGVGDGDATLIIGIDETQTGFMDTVTVLIDGNRSSKPGNAIWAYVRDTLNALAPARKRLDFLILSHLHIDHYGGLITVVNNLQNEGWKIGNVVDRSGAGKQPILKWSIDSNYKYECVDEEISFPEYTSTASKYASLTSIYSKVTILPGIDVFGGKNFKNLSMICVAAMGAALTNTDPYYSMFLRYNGSEYLPYNENDLSFAFNLGFKGFNFFTGGDIGGGPPYADGETPIANCLAARFNGNFHYCGIKVSHHGSAHSTNANFLNGLAPTMAVIPANLRTYSGTALPTQTTVQQLLNALNPSSNLLFCFQPTDPQTQSNYWTAGKLQYYNDVTIKVIGVPAVGNNPVQMQLTTRRRKKDDLSFIETGQRSVINCTKAHLCSFK